MSKLRSWTSCRILEQSEISSISDRTLCFFFSFPRGKGNRTWKKTDIGSSPTNCQALSMYITYITIFRFTLATKSYQPETKRGISSHLTPQLKIQLEVKNLVWRCKPANSQTFYIFRKISCVTFFFTKVYFAHQPVSFIRVLSYLDFTHN